MNMESRVYTTDDVCPSNLQYFKYWQMVKEAKLDLKLVCFTIANNKNIENVKDSIEFNQWFSENKDWVEIGVHGYDHEKPQEGWREDQEKYIKKSLDILAPYLPEKYLYRAPGFRVLPKTEKILRELGFAGIAHQGFIKYFETGIITQTIDTHCTDEFKNPITKLWTKLVSF